MVEEVAGVVIDCQKSVVDATLPCRNLASLNPCSGCDLFRVFEMEWGNQNDHDTPAR